MTNPAADTVELTTATGKTVKLSLSRMRIAFELEGQEPDEVTIRSRSRVAWDMTRAKRQWPKTDEAPMLWIDFLCWHALVAEGRYAGKWEDFQNDCISTEPQDDVPADPTPQAEPAI